MENTYPKRLRSFALPQGSKVAATWLILFLLCFPKGGIKLVGIPLTWGYLLLFTIGTFCWITKPLVLQKNAFKCLLALVPFQLIAFATLFLYGTENLGYSFSLFIHFFLIPWFFWGVFPQYLSQELLNDILEGARRGVFFVASFGIFLFLYKIATGTFLEIPFLTINYHDYKQLETLKCIDRGGIFKLISTYNNGNLYGICILMLLPLYQHLEKRLSKRLLVKLSLILTLSRTIWLGLFLYELLIPLTYKISLLKKGINIIFSLPGIGLSLLLLHRFFPFSLDFLLDRFLGNRLGQLEVLHDFQFFSTKPFQEVFEIIYLGILKSFGVVGLLAFLLAMIYPLLLPSTSSFKAPLSLGLFLYLLIALGDGALLLIPVMCFYSFIVFLLHGTAKASFTS
ncbi:MAG: hypothetical protein FJZ63_00045 [Chlamydiae bacterium]|nr:hypothetical protein [Chlamydiota bacterium]